jgi:hypothetical protein
MNAWTIDGLNLLLRDELAAVETYDEALTRRTSLLDSTDVAQCKRSHEVRARLLRNKIFALGGTPATSSGLRGVWERLVEEGAFAIGDDVAVRALEAGEDQILRDYRAGLPKLDPEIRSFVERSLLPGEEYTHRTMSHLVGRRFH